MKMMTTMTTNKTQDAIDYLERILDGLGLENPNSDFCTTALIALRNQEELYKIAPERLDEIIRAENDGRCITFPTQPDQDCYVAFYTSGKILPVIVKEYKWCVWDKEWVLITNTGRSYYIKDAFPTREEAVRAVKAHSQSAS